MKIASALIALVMTSGAASAATPEHAVCEAARSDTACPPPGASAPDAPGCACEVVTRAEGKAELKELVAVRVHGQSPDSPGEIDEIHLGLRVGDAWRSVGQLVTSWTPGAFGIQNEGKLVSLEVATVKGVGDVATLVLKQSHYDSDMGMNAVTMVDSESRVYCFAHEQKPVCVELWTLAEGGVDAMNDEDPAPEGYGPLGIKKATRAVSLNAKGEVVIGKAKGEVPQGFEKVSGKKTLVQLSTTKDVRVLR